MTANVIAKSASTLRQHFGALPPIAVVLGSGFSHAVDDLPLLAKVSFNQLPGFLPSNVPGHPGCLSLAQVHQHPVLFLCGRSHFYEGGSMDQVTLPIRVLAEVGVQTLLLTNAAGGIHPKFKPGDFMVISDHINFMGANPLRSALTHSPQDFVDLSQVYDLTLQKHLLHTAKKVGARCLKGVYIAVSGPSYETPAEIKAFARWGADAVGMSTVPEAIVARRLGMRVAGLSLITNLAAGRAPTGIHHDEVLREASIARRRISDLIKGFLSALPCYVG